MDQKLANKVVGEMKAQGMPMGLTAVALSEVETDEQLTAIMNYLIEIKNKKVKAKEAIIKIQEIIDTLKTSN